MKSGLHSSRTIINGAIKDATVFIQDGVIAGIAPGLSAPPDIPLTDVQNSVLMAGVIDPHVHINEPGRTEWEGFETATKAAISGGITMLVDMPLNSSPVLTTTTAFDLKATAAHSKLYCNCGFWGGIVPGNTAAIEPLIEKGVLGFKAFLTPSGIDEFPNALEADLRQAMPFLAKHGLPLLVHCELSENDSVFTANDPLNNRYKYYLASRPTHWEDNAIALMINLCREYNCKTHIVHLSSANSINQIAAAKAEGLPLTVETAQHYLYFNAEEIADGETQFKCAPPIRGKENNELLWQALKDGIIDFVATDHSPAPPAMKHLQSGNFMQAWGGIASLQFALPILWTVAMKKDTRITDIPRWLCSKPANLAGLQHKKGSIEKGFDADFVIWDPEESFIVTEEKYIAPA